MLDPLIRHQRERLVDLDRALTDHASNLALFLVFDRPSRVDERPALARTFFAQRCLSDDQLEGIIQAFRSVGAYVELFEGEQPFIRALADGHSRRIGRDLCVAYNGIGWGIGQGAFQAGRKALVPLLADSYGLICANSDAYACAFTLHKFHCFRILRSLGIDSPETWQYQIATGWVGDQAPPAGMRVIVKSTYEAWSVGVTDQSIFVYDESSEGRVRSIASDIGQSVTVQRFIPGAEVYVSILSTPDKIVFPPVQVILTKAPDDVNAVVTIEDNLRSDATTYRFLDQQPRLVAELQDRAAAVFDALQLEGLARIDFRVDAEGRPWVFDVAISPGLGRAAPSFTAASRYELSYEAFLRTVVAGTLATRGLLPS